MKITDALRGEHGPLYALFLHCEESALKWELADLLLAGRCLEAALLAHAHVEDDILFAAVEQVMPPGGPTSEMRADHDEIDHELALLRAATTESQARQALAAVIDKARDHFEKEEVVLFPLADELLPAAELERLARVWADRRGAACADRAPCSI
jgi:iron-sulfur cluster repair protein YtfE (RIC family)